MRAHSLRGQGAIGAPAPATPATRTATGGHPRGGRAPSGPLRGARPPLPQRKSVVCATPGSGAAASAAHASVSAFPASSPASSPAPSSSPPPAGVPPFSWTAQWYPVSFLEDLDESQPNAFTLLGVKLALYLEKGGDGGRWVALEDSCPHRRAPLSQGRLLTERDPVTGAIERTSLECSYHGWVFGGVQGKCSKIPQLSGCSTLVSPGAAAAAAASPRACATPRPCRAAQGMLWVWGEGPRAAAAASGGGKRSKKMGRPSSGFSSSFDRGSENEGGGAFEAAGGGPEEEEEEEDTVARMFRESEETEPIYAPGISVDDAGVASDALPSAAGRGGKPEKLLTLAGRYSRDVEYDATTLIDNLLDASHLAFAHNRVLGDRDAFDAGDVAAARVSLDPESGEEVETAALAAVLSSTRHKREREAGGGGGEGGRRHLDRHSAGARALRTESLTGDAAIFDSAFRVPRTDKDGRMLTRILFEPPALATWFCDKPDGDPVCAGSRWRSMPIFVTPTEPGRCRILFQIRYPDSPRVNKFIKLMLRLRPEWANHFFSSEVTDGDSRLLWPTEDRAASAVAAALGAAAAASSSPSSPPPPPPSASEVGLAFFKTNYMPAPADAPIVAYRKWLFGRGGGGPFGSPFAPSPLVSPSTAPSPASASSSSASYSPSSKLPEHLAEASILSRYEQHTKHCRSCSVALRNAVKVKRAGAAAALLLASAAAGAAGARAPAAVAARWALAAAAAALAAWAESRAERSLTYSGYNHSHKH